MRISLIALAIAMPASVSAQLVQPGQWETVSTVTSVKGNIPPSVAGALRGRPTKVLHCVTPAEAAQGPREMMKPSSGCKFTHYTMALGHYSSALTCNRPGMTMTVNASGAYTPTSWEGSATMQMTGRMAMTTTTSVKARRIGACK